MKIIGGVMLKLNAKVTQEQMDFLEREFENKSEAIREIIDFYMHAKSSNNKEMVELEIKNKELQSAIMTMKLALQQNDKRMEENIHHYEQRLSEKDDKYNTLEIVQREQANVYNTILKQKDDLLTEIKNMGMWKRAFLKLA
jgi:hypothetical protein